MTAAGAAPRRWCWDMKRRTVISAGPGAGFGPGDRVAVTLIGDCRYCASGSRTHCQTEKHNETVVLRDAAGAPVEQGLKTAAFAEEVVVHESQLARLGPEAGRRRRWPAA